jgi:hypothetical protein
MTLRTLPAALLPLAAWCITACMDPTGSAPAPAAVMLGEWTYARAPSAAGSPPTLNAGLSVAIAVDSASGMRFWGHVARWFVGDVGLPVTRFGPVSGSIDSTSGVVLRIHGRQIAALRIEGEVAGDVLTVHASWAGVEPGPFPSGCRFQRLH